MVANRRKRLADRLRAAVSVLVGAVMLVFIVGFGLNSLVRSVETMPPDGAVVVMLDRPNKGWFRSIDSRSWGEFDDQPLANLITRAEAEELGLKPHPNDLRDGLFHKECGFLQQMLINRGVLPRSRRWIVLKDGRPTWDNGAILSARDRKRFDMD